MRSKKSIVLTLILLIPFSLQCAKEGMPPGGAVDTTPPEVVSISPEPNSTKVDLNTKIKIGFSERMTQKPTEESIFISPFPKEPFDYKWKGKRLILSPSEPLLKNKTYVVTIGSGAQDLRRNNLSESYTFAFSTGAALDYGTISGEVWSKQKDRFKTESGISIWAYVFPDTIEIDPESHKPDYITQSDVEGKYIFKNLSAGKYRLFAVEDLNRDQIWNPDKEAIGVTTNEVTLTPDDNSASHVDFIVALRDTTRPSLLDCQSLNKNKLRLDFDENLKEKSVLNLHNFKIVFVSTSESLKVTEVYHQENYTKNVFLLTAETSPREKYELEVSELEDESGNPLDTSANTCLFVGSEISDTSGPKVTSTSPKDGESTVRQDAEIKMLFDEPPMHTAVESSFSLLDSLGVLTTGESRWLNPNTFAFSPYNLLAGGMKYQARLECGSIKDHIGNPMSDSVLVVAFTTLSPDALGSLSGDVQILGESTSEEIVVTLTLMEQTKERYQKSLPKPGLFLFENMLPGKYMVGAYVDLNGDRNLTIGNPKPFIPCEPFTFFPDTLTVRSRWETQGVELKFR